MKDEEVRERISRVEGRMRRLEQIVSPSFPKDISIKECPKCKHPVLARVIASFTEEAAFYPGGKKQYQCLTCGSKFTCSEKCVCELVEGK